jgi:hypothetical protein
MQVVRELDLNTFTASIGESKSNAANSSVGLHVDVIPRVCEQEFEGIPMDASVPEVSVLTKRDLYKRLLIT